MAAKITIELELSERCTIDGAEAFADDLRQHMELSTGAFLYQDYDMAKLNVFVEEV